MAFRQQRNVMDYAKRAGQNVAIADMMEALKLQHEGLPGEMSEYAEDKSYLDVGSSIISDVILNAAIGPVTSTLDWATGKALPLLNKLGLGGGDNSILSKLLGRGVKGGAKSFLSKGISDVLADIFKIKPPKAPSVDMSRLTGPGMGRVKRSIQDSLAHSTASYEDAMKQIEDQRSTLNLLSSLVPELKKPFGEFTLGGTQYEGKVSPYNLIRKSLGLTGYEEEE